MGATLSINTQGGKMTEILIVLIVLFVTSNGRRQNHQCGK
jgi:hypothetical protein